ncbi:uncharacterized protein RAG0_04107 [Rhynchosporium agropyri]|uniref:Ecp2 effector protein domain-containing protein n=1 Tax=Rhynchosporium agropyri TaxID=914238 RepID=A0A1E1K7L5_9HELO|nr:uncharacterized protein RAG0_04107 [Rhynchosporium agropyri]
MGFTLRLLLLSFVAGTAMSLAPCGVIEGRELTTSDTRYLTKMCWANYFRSNFDANDDYWGMGMAPLHDSPLPSCKYGVSPGFQRLLKDLELGYDKPISKSPTTTLSGDRFPSQTARKDYHNDSLADESIEQACKLRSHITLNYGHRNIILLFSSDHNDSSLKHANWSIDSDGNSSKHLDDEWSGTGTGTGTGTGVEQQGKFGGRECRRCCSLVEVIESKSRFISWKLMWLNRHNVQLACSIVLPVTCALSRGKRSSCQAKVERA